MDYVIVTCFESDIAIYRHADLAQAITNCAQDELEDYPEALERVLADPTFDTLCVELGNLDTDVYLSVPGEDQ